MGMRYGMSREGAPGMLLLAAGAQAAEAVGLGVVIVFNVIDSVSGRVSTAGNGIAFIVFELIIAIGVAWIAWGIAQVRPWSRTPAVLTQAFTVLIAIWLLQAHRFAWGVPALLLALAAAAGLFAPASFRALNRPEPPDNDRDSAQPAARAGRAKTVNRRS